MEAPPRLELGNKGFADLCLTTWLWRHLTSASRETLFFLFAARYAARIAMAFAIGADYGARTRHLDLGKVALYQMS